MDQNKRAYPGIGRIEVRPDGELAINGMSFDTLGIERPIHTVMFYEQQYRNTELILPVIDGEQLDEYYQSILPTKKVYLDEH